MPIYRSLLLYNEPNFEAYRKVNILQLCNLAASLYTYTYCLSTYVEHVLIQFDFHPVQGEKVLVEKPAQTVTGKDNRYTTHRI